MIIPSRGGGYEFCGNIVAQVRSFGLAEMQTEPAASPKDVRSGPGKLVGKQVIDLKTVQVMGNDAAITFGGASGYLDMNVYKPLMIYNLLQSSRLLMDGCHCFTEYLVLGLEINRKQIENYLQRSLMLVTALSPVIGYDKASEIAHLAHEQELTLKEAALQLGYVSEAEFDEVVDPYKMARPFRR